ncbi:MAG: hypothetical protein PHE73_00995 [Sulfurovaceae bacterium]|nr:hypothetical protein [Sulfurovaceae bacterium]
MKKLKILASFLLLFNISNASSDINANSELSHFAGGIMTAGILTYGVDKFYPKYSENRAEIGFWTSSIIIVVESAIEYANDGNGTNQAIDAASHIIGSAIGAYVTNKYILTPVVRKTADGTSVGLQAQGTF